MRSKNQSDELALHLSRRAFLRSASLGGLGALALGELLGSNIARAATGSSTDLGILGTGQIPASAKRVIYLFMAGAPSQVDTFDYKPELFKRHGQEMPSSVMAKQRLSTMVKGQATFPLVAPLAQFRQRGQNGTWVNDLIPHIGDVIDEFTLIKSMTTDQVNHDPAIKMLQSGFQLAGRPSIGAWVNYGLGTDNDNLPAFVVMSSLGEGGAQNINSEIWSAGFLPSRFQGVLLQRGKDPVLYVGNPAGISAEERGVAISAINEIAKMQFERTKNPEILTKISQYEMAYRMQSSVPEATDISDEPDHVKALYGPAVETPGSYARNCLLARRLAERDVKFIQLYHNCWDHHARHPVLHPKNLKEIDQPTAGLLKDLKQRGLLDDTLLIWGGEFGRTCFSQGALTGDTWGRDHHTGCFTYLLAGGGIRRGYVHGETDEFSYLTVKDAVSTYDFQATLMHMLGIDHEHLTYRYQGRDFRLTDVHGRVVQEVLA